MRRLDEYEDGPSPRKATMKRRTDKKSSPQPVLPLEEQLDVGGLEQWLWDAACSIRGAVDAPKFKDYILPLIFVKRLSDVFEDEIDQFSGKFGDRETALELVEDDHSLVRFYLPHECAWSEIRKLGTNVGQRLTDVIRKITKANPTLQGVIDIVDFNATVSGQRIVDDGRLSTLIEILSRHRLGLKDVEPDILGRAYEYLLRKFAEGQGQSAGEFFTPKEVGWLIARLLVPEEGMEVYDPACGSAGLLVKAQLTLKKSVNNAKRPLRLYGQELNHVTYAIAKMNMIIHDMEGEIAIGDTLRAPKFLNGSKLKTFDLIAANPMWNQDGYGDDFYETDQHDRFKFGFPPASTADWGWTQHMFSSLNRKGRAVIVLDAGAVSRGSGGQGSNREREIRKSFVDRDFIEAIVLLPENLFYNTGSQGLLLCLNRAKPESRRDKIVLINAAGVFEKGHPKNFIPDAGLDRVIEAFRTAVNIPGFVRVISTAEAADRDYNLSPGQWIARGERSPSLSVDDVLLLIREADEARREAEGATRDLFSELVRESDGNAGLSETALGPLPQDWKVVRLGDVADCRGGYGFPHGEQGRRDGEFPFFKVSDMNLADNAVFMTRANNYVDEATVRRLKAKPFAKGSIIFPKIGAAIATNKKRILSQPSLVDNNVMGVTVKDEGVSWPLYLYVWFLHVDLRDLTAPGPLPSIAQHAVKESLVPLPSLQEQKAIGNAFLAVQGSLESARSMTFAMEHAVTAVVESLVSGRRRLAGDKGV
jgi:type I restriction enzyme M protein